LDEIKTSELYGTYPDYLAPLFLECEYPWQIIPKIREYISMLIKGGMKGYTEKESGIFVGENVKIYPSATLIAPLIIGSETEIRPGAFLRGSVITGERCVIGNSSEVKNSILLDRVQLPHYNYVGDSILGNKCHTGAGAICSNLKSDGKPVVIHGECEYETGLRKIGAILADHADIGCGCVLNPGTVVGKNTSVYPLTALRGVYPENSIVKGTKETVYRR
jgi:NDP-sugar pyrophosphorylase family protein